MKHIINIGFFIAIILFNFSCKEDEIELYSGAETLNILIQDKSEVEMSFLSFPPSVTEFKYDVTVNLQTVIADRDRSVNLVVTDSSTATLGTNFSVSNDAVIKAGQSSVTIPITLYRNGLDAVEGGLKVVLALAESKDFSVNGVHKEVSIKFSDEYPTSWYTTHSQGVACIPYMWGRCTKAKYKFVYQQLGTIDLYDFSGWSAMMAVSNKATEFNNIIDAWNNDPNNADDLLLDDDGSVMKFSAAT